MTQQRAVPTIDDIQAMEAELARLRCEPTMPGGDAIMIQVEKALAQMRTIEGKLSGRAPAPRAAATSAPLTVAPRAPASAGAGIGFAALLSEDDL